MVIIRTCLLTGFILPIDDGVAKESGAIESNPSDTKLRWWCGRRNLSTTRGASRNWDVLIIDPTLQLLLGESQAETLSLTPAARLEAIASGMP